MQNFDMGAGQGVPLSSEQRKIWFQYSLQSELPVYNIAELFRIEGAFDLDLFCAAVRQVVGNHAGLTVRFHERGDDLLQLPCADLAVVDFIEHHRRFDHEQDALAFLRSRVLRPFDLHADLPVRVDIVPFGEQRHLVAFGVHHIVYDGWSSGLFFTELNQAYQDRLDGQAPTGPKDSYLSYPAWQQEADQLDTQQYSKDYWLSYLKGVTPRLELPLNRKRGKNFDFHGASESFTIPADLFGAIDALALRQKVTPFTVMLTVFSILLQRYSRQRDFCIGYPSANRGMPGAEDIIGLFTNTLVYRVQFDPQDQFADVLAATYEALLDAYGNESVQLEKVMEVLNLPRDGAYNPLFQVIFAQQDRRGHGLRLPGTCVQALEHPVNTAKLDLSVMIDIDEHGARGVVEYASAVFERDEVASIWHHYLQLLASFCDDSAQQVRQPLLNDATALTAMVQQTVAGQGHASLHAWFAQVARTYPERIAVEYVDASLSYAQLDEQAYRLSRRLLRHGACAGTLVGLSLPRGTQLIVAMLAILKAGCGYLPLDPSYPAERLQFMIEDARCALVIVADRTSSPFSGTAITQVMPGEDDQGDDGAPAPVDQVTPASLAYCIYTSGSTGKPKGVLISHRNVMRLFEQTGHWFEFNCHDVWTMFHSYSFDFSVWEIFGALLYGGKLVIVPYDISRSPHDFRRLLKEKSVTVLNQTPSAFQQLSQADLGERGDADRLDALRYIVFGGESLNLQSLAPWVQHYGDAKPKLINMYGITETTVHVTYREIMKRDIEQQSGSLIGVPIPDLFLLLRDEAGRPVPAGIIGEIYVGGEGVALGYHQREQLNSERFLLETLPDGQRQRLYRTGDLAKRRLDGELEYIGRIDHQVKIRGHRIEIGEIEEQLLAQPGVQQACVLVKKDGMGNERLLAWVAATTGQAPDPLVLKRMLSHTLPSFMMPQDIMLVEQIPLTQNGKVNKDQLLAMAFTATRDEQRYVAPASGLEHQILAAWMEVLERERIGTHDNFFAIGGDSIRAVMVVQRCRRQGMMLSVIDLLNHQTIAGLALQAEKNRAAGAPAARAQPALAPALRAPAAWSAQLDIAAPIYPVSGMQSIMFDNYLKHAGDGRGVYHVQQSYRLEDAQPDSAAMQAAITQLIAVHPVLRTVCLHTDSGQWLQTIVADMAVPLVEHDLTALDGAAQEREILALRQADLRRPFTHNRMDAALLRFEWIALSASCFELFMSIHHGIDDGWGNQMFLSQLFDTYLAIKAGKAHPIPLQDNVLLEYVALETANASDPAHRTFWRGVTSPSPALALRGPGCAANSAIEFRMSPVLSAAVQKVARDYKTTLRALLISILQPGLARALDRPAFSLGIVMNGRKDVLSDPLHSLGLFWNMLPLPLHMAPFEQRLNDNHRHLLDMDKFSAFPAQQASAAGGAEPEVTFNFVNFHNRTEYGGGALGLLGEHGHDYFHYPLNIFVALEKGSGELYVKIESDAGCVELALAQRVLDDFADALHQVAAGAAKLLAENG